MWLIGGAAATAAITTAAPAAQATPQPRPAASVPALADALTADQPVKVPPGHLRPLWRKDPEDRRGG